MVAALTNARMVTDVLDTVRNVLEHGVLVVDELRLQRRLCHLNTNGVVLLEKLLHIQKRENTRALHST